MDLAPGLVGSILGPSGRKHGPLLSGTSNHKQSQEKKRVFRPAMRHVPVRFVKILSG